jgi:hypothetical protein
MTWHLIPTLAVAWLVQNLVHEGSHLLAGWIFEGRKPLIAPFYAGLIWVTAWLFAAVLVPERLWPYCMPFALCGLVDALFFWWGYYWGSPQSDGQRYRHMVDR